MKASAHCADLQRRRHAETESFKTKAGGLERKLQSDVEIMLVLRVPKLTASCFWQTKPDVSKGNVLEHDGVVGGGGGGGAGGGVGGVGGSDGGAGGDGDGDSGGGRLRRQTDLPSSIAVGGRAGLNCAKRKRARLERPWMRVESRKRPRARVRQSKASMCLGPPSRHAQATQGRGRTVGCNHVSILELYAAPCIARSHL
eukprot:4382182-Pleurochrysis_carterae.AAC.5